MLLYIYRLIMWKLILFWVMYNYVMLFCAVQWCIRVYKWDKFNVVAHLYNYTIVVWQSRKFAWFRNQENTRKAHEPYCDTFLFLRISRRMPAKFCLCSTRRVKQSIRLEPWLKTGMSPANHDQSGHRRKTLDCSKTNAIKNIFSLLNELKVR